ncbi:diaminopimelate epimerase [Candidatus Liberibacter americanus]|uniref:Diaminopimelate epimerase n=1 Tax=Candidatus Liberibacter americanus str. Sao Paulo TaxID=1261131 RepID=U6B3U7_9HYPH|nr:diaminopimelate epimerase [Candidatus Liberibacter americanus]AHA27615.1 Diaminopimelate epimerase [Candidatus Liberibacter americanus str. Sao Paulo]EMS36323.1 diaminopimelate epimerase [Candidatus Liberibacter americanus PW_SP]
MINKSNVDFAKMEGIGNKILVVDMRNRSDSINLHAINVLLSDEKTCFDQMMIIYSSKDTIADAFIRIINRDGSEAQSCGNGMRCVVRFLSMRMKKKSFVFETLRGTIKAKENEDNSISVDMGEPIFNWKNIPLSQPFDSRDRDEFYLGPINDVVLRSPYILSMGNPHAIFFVEYDIYSYDLLGFGNIVKNHFMFPEGINLSIAKVTSCSSIDLRTCERGVGLTAACGTAACASVVASAYSEKTNRIASVNMPGGQILIEWCHDNHVILTGTADEKWSGILDVKNGKWLLI